MTLEEYLGIRNNRTKHGSINATLNMKEASILKLDIKVSGWYKRNSTMVISEEDLVLLLPLLSEYKNKKKESQLGQQFVYLIRNSHYDYKIGISKHPKKRLVSLSSGSSSKLLLVQTWKSEVYSEQLEKELHALFKEYKLRGEWFNFKGLTEDKVVERVENYILSRV